MDIRDCISGELLIAYLSLEHNQKLRVYDFILSLLRSECSQPHFASYQEEALQADG